MELNLYINTLHLVIFLPDTTSAGLWSYCETTQSIPQWLE